MAYNKALPASWWVAPALRLDGKGVSTMSMLFVNGAWIRAVYIAFLLLSPTSILLASRASFGDALRIAILLFPAAGFIVYLQFISSRKFIRFPNRVERLLFDAHERNSGIFFWQTVAGVVLTAPVFVLVVVQLDWAVHGVDIYALMILWVSAYGFAADAFVLHSRGKLV